MPTGRVQWLAALPACEAPTLAGPFAVMACGLLSCAITTTTRIGA